MATRDRSPGSPPATGRTKEPAATDGPEDEGFLGRWSRRKVAAKTTDASPEAASIEPDTSPALPAANNEPDEASPPVIDPATLPDIDSLGPGSDFSIFMQAGVPPAIKTKALRKLWRVKPELANLDGLLDYGEDLTGSFKVVDHLKTAYEVGRGFLRDGDEVEPDDSQPDHDGNDLVETASGENGMEDEPQQIDQTSARDGVDLTAVDIKPQRGKDPQG